MNVPSLQLGRVPVPDLQWDDHAVGMIPAFVVERELARLRGDAATVTAPLTPEERGERALQIRDPDLIIIKPIGLKAPAFMSTSGPGTGPLG